MKDKELRKSLSAAGVIFEGGATTISFDSLIKERDKLINVAENYNLDISRLEIMIDAQVTAISRQNKIIEALMDHLGYDLQSGDFIIDPDGGKTEL